MAKRIFPTFTVLPAILNIAHMLKSCFLDCPLYISSMITDKQVLKVWKMYQQKEDIQLIIALGKKKKIDITAADIKNAFGGKEISADEFLIINHFYIERINIVKAQQKQLMESVSGNGKRISIEIEQPSVKISGIKNQSAVAILTDKKLNKQTKKKSNESITKKRSKKVS